MTGIKIPLYAQTSGRKEKPALKRRRNFPSRYDEREVIV
jgi:hypothetical protein